jgi:putative transposase
VRRRRRRRELRHPGLVPIATTAPNDLWTADFKSQFRTGNGRVLLFAHHRLPAHARLARVSRVALDRDGDRPARVRARLPRVRTPRCDPNSVLFATLAIHGLSYLNVVDETRDCAAAYSSWITAGERSVRADAPDAQTAGRQTSAAHLRQAATAVRRFRTEYNAERPHDALGGDTSGSRYSRSRLAYPERLRTPECRGHFLIKHVTDASTFRFQQRLLYIANALVNQHIGLEETDDGVWATYFKTVLLATLDELDFVIRG